MGKKTSTPFSPNLKAPTIISIQPYLKDERCVAALKLLCIEWNRYWKEPGEFPRSKMKRELLATEDFMRSRFNWMHTAIDLQRRSRSVLTRESKELAEYHIKSLFETLQAQEAINRLPAV